MSAANGTALEPRRLALQQWESEYARLIKSTVLRPKNREATSPELAMFAEQVQRTGLDPFLGQIYGIYRKQDGVEQMTVQVGIDGFRLIAERTQKYQGQTEVEWCGTDGKWTDVWLADESPAAARVGVYKAGHVKPTIAVAHWREYAQKTSSGAVTKMWRQMPANQLAKCAEALALRKCFPAELSGLYTPEEMAQADSPPPEVVAALPEQDSRANGDQVERLVGLAREAVEAGLFDEKRLSMMLVDAEAADTSTVQAAAETMTAEQVERLASALADQLAEREETSA